MPPSRKERSVADNEKLLTRIRDRYQYCLDSWREIREEGRTDMRFIAGDSWDPKEKEARRLAKRPCLNLDELSAYINQRINDVRLNKRAVKVIPKGSGANDKTAELRSDIIRTIEAKQGQSAYITAFENALQRSYGFFRIGKRYADDKSFEQELFIGRIPNPDTVHIDPDAKEADYSDIRFAFVTEDIDREIFKSRWPSAEIKDFDSELAVQHPQWIKENSIQVAEYWEIENKTRLMYLIGDQSGQPITVYDDELPKGQKLSPDMVLKQRKVEENSVIQYITNGVEILERNEWEGKWIPIVGVYGKELWIDNGSGSKRILVSLVRLARDAQLLYNYYRSAEAEVVGMTPKTPWVGYEGQFEGHETEWENANRVPYAYLQAKPVLDATGQAVLPLPTRNTYEPPIQALEMGAESARRSIQAAMGTNSLPTQAQRQNEKSGVALQRIEQAQAQGGFHFLDNYDRALEHAGRILNDMIPHVYDTPRDVAIRKQDESAQSIKINEPYQDEKTGEQHHHEATKGDHEVSISTGPSFQSQREEAGAFAEVLAQNPAIFARVADLVVKMKQLGPIGDEIAERLTPPEFVKDKQNPQQQAAQLQQAMGMVEAMTQQLNALTQERESKTAEIESKERIAALQASTTIEVERMKLGAAAEVNQMKFELQGIQTQIQAMLDGKALEASQQKAAQDAQLKAAGMQQQGQQAQAQQQLAERQQGASEQQAQQNFGLQQQQAAQQAQGGPEAQV
jgi:hypothetical protein